MFSRHNVQKLAGCGVLTLTTVLMAPAVFAQDFYISGSIGQMMLDDPKNNGTFTSEFTTGEVTGVSPPLVLPVGAPVGWNTQLDDGSFYSIAGGLKTSLFRYELEYSASSSDVKSHTNVSAGGIDLTNIDVGVLLTGNVGDVGVSVGDFVAAGQGDVESQSVFVNAYYDFNKEGALSPYIGLGIGNTTVDVNYRPSATEIINDNDSVFSYQLILGLSYSFNDSVDVFGSYRYRDGDDPQVNASLLPASFSIEGSTSNTLEIGLRYNF